MNKHIKILLCLLLGQCLYAQQGDTIKDLPAEQVEVIKLFEARLADARKVNINPEPPAQRKLKEFNYEVNIRPILLEYPAPQIKPLEVSAEPEIRKYNGLLRIAGGNLNTLDAGVAYNFLTKQETEIGLNADYLSMNNKKERFQQVQNIDANIHFAHSISSLVSFSGELDFHSQDVGFYGSPLPENITDTTIYKRKLNDYGIGFKVFNAQENEFDVDYQLGFNFQNFNLVNEDLVENNLYVDGLLSKKINKHLSFGLGAIADISSITDTATLSYNNFLLEPEVKYNSEFFRLDAGMVFGFTGEKTYYLPNVELSFSPIDYGFVPYVFWKGSLQKNNIQTLFSYNPYLRTSIVPELRNSVLMRYGIGARGSLSSINYEADVAYGKTDDLILFNNFIDENGLRKFDISSDTSNILEVNLMADYKVNEHLILSTNFEFIDYSIVAWHLPSYRFDFGLSSYLLDRKLKLNPSLYIRDGVTVLNDEREQEELPYMIDLNFHTQYQIGSQFLLYGEVNNILSSEYQRWYDYSNFGLNAKLGLKIKF